MKILYGLLCLVFLIIFHEFGHFIMAKICGVTVEAFSVGFGPVLLHKKIRGTDWRLSLIPLGGYCGMKGEKEFQDSLKAGLDYIKADSDSLYGVHPFKRVLIAFFGPFANFFFAFLCFTVIALTGYSYYSYSSKVTLADEIYPELHSAARDAGIQSGDKIIKINGKAIETFSDIISEIVSKPDEDIKITVLRNEEEMEFLVHSDLDKDTGAGKIGVTADTETLSKYEMARLSFFPALLKGLTESINALKLTVKGIFTLFKGVKLDNAVSGPARVVDMMGSVVKESFSGGFREGLVNTLNFMGFISISLCFMNLLPVPILDGGLILFALIELISRRKLSPKVLYYIQFIGIAFIAFLFILGLTGDVKYFIGNLKK